MKKPEKMDKPEKLSLEECIDAMSFFYVDDAFEDEMEREQEQRIQETRELYKQIEEISTYEGLEKYIRDDEKSLHNLTNLLGVSEENFKRVVSLIRRNHGDNYKSEWDIKKIRNSMLRDSYYMEEICGLLLGEKEKDYGKDIPRFVLNQLVMDREKLKDFSSTKKVLPEMIKNTFKGTYSTKVGKKVEDLVEEVIKDSVGEGHYVCQRMVFNRNIDFVIPNEENPQVLIEVSYMATTGSGQSTKREAMLNVAKAVRDQNVYGAKKEMIFINVIDGAGWLARQSDLEKIYRASDYVININNIASLKRILTYYYNVEGNG